MKDRKKRKQREEVRKILHAMRLELAAQRAVQEAGAQKGIMLRIGETISRAQAI